VEEALADADALAGRQAEYARALEARGRELEVALEQARQACFERDRRISWLEGELDLSRSAATTQLRGLAALGAELDALTISSRAQATRIRLRALREAAEVSIAARRLATPSRGRQNELLAALTGALDRLGAETTEELSDDAPASAGPDEASLIAGGARPAPADGHRVSVDVGPFRDFSQLVSFEDAANSIGAAGEISIRRFSEGRASIEVDLEQPIDLLRELEERCDLEFKVRASGDHEIILDLDE
jgi:hypothetical protein